MERAGVGFSTALDPEIAARQASEEALAQAGLARAAGALLLATAAHGVALEKAVAMAAECLGSDAVAGGAVEGLLTADRFVDGNPGVAVLAFGAHREHRGGAGPRAQGLLLRDLVGAEEDAGEELRAHIGVAPAAGDLLVLFADSHALLARPLLAAVEAALEPALVVGLGASPIPGAAPLVWGQGEVAEAALAALFLRGAGPAWAGVGHGCRPVSKELRVTRARGNWVLGLEGRPALDVYLEAAGEAEADELSADPRALLAALSIEGRQAPDGAGFLERGAFVVREIVGLDPEHRAFSVPEPMESGRALAFARSDPARAGAELEAMLSGGGVGNPALGLHFHASRGAGSRRGAAPSPLSPGLARCLDGLPLLGGAGAYQIGPVAGLAGGRSCQLLTRSELLVLLPG
jgi:small ligand-binding sensory domain FIST